MLRKVFSVRFLILLLALVCFGDAGGCANQKTPDSVGNTTSPEITDAETDTDTGIDTVDTAIFDTHLQLFIRSLESEDVELYVIEEEENAVDYRSDSIKRIDKRLFLDFVNELPYLSYIPLENHHSFYEAERQYTIFTQTDNATVQAITIAGDFAFLNVSNHYENGSHSLFGSQTDELSGINESFKALLDQSTSMNILTAEEVMRKKCDSDAYEFSFRDGTIYAVKESEDDERRYRLTLDCASAGGIVGYRPCYSVATTLDVYDKQTGEWIENESKFAGILDYSMFDGRML